ncbi:MAG: CbiX/SirB N-terminal domain-containing protein [Candidatus Eremiobacterota bacterium]
MSDSKKRLILVVHGSRDHAWLLPFKKLEHILKEEMGEHAVRLACMQFVSPTIEETGEEAVKDGIFNLSFLPLFMSTGGHVERDIPVKIKSLRERWPELNIEILPPLGEHPKFIQLVREIVKEAL